MTKVLAFLAAFFTATAALAQVPSGIQILDTNNALVGNISGGPAGGQIVHPVIGSANWVGVYSGSVGKQGFITDVSVTLGVLTPPGVINGSYLFTQLNCNGPVYMDARDLPVIGYFNNAQGVSQGPDELPSVQLSHPVQPFTALPIFSIYISTNNPRCENTAGGSVVVGLRQIDTLTFAPPFHLN